MTWTAPRTFTAGEVVTAAMLNAQIRDNELVMATTPTSNSYAASNSFTKAADAKWFTVEGWGGGGSGSAVGAGTGQAAGSGGGGAGMFMNMYTAAALATTTAFTVGIGGNGNSGNGNTGTATTFLACTANGGACGTSMTPTTGNASTLPGIGGTATGGIKNLAGDDGGRGHVNSGVTIFTNFGGGSPGGGGQTTYPGSGSGTGAVGNFPGGGASGSVGSGAGFNGATGAGGKLIITSYFAG